MGMSFGGQTVTFVSLTPTGTVDPLGTQTLTEAATDVTGCRHRPITISAGGGSGAVRNENPEIGVTVATQYWQTTCPPHPAALAAKASDVLRVDGETFQIIGDVQPFTDFSGRVFKVTFVSERQTIG